MKRKTTQQFIEQAINIYGTAYSYTNTVYVNAKTPVAITCTKHNVDFTQYPNDHIRGGLACPECKTEHARNIRLGKSIVPAARRIADFTRYKKLAITTHDKLYDYTHFEYTNSTTKSVIICPDHGSFEQSMFDHAKRKHKCPKCNISVNDFIKRANTTHDNKYQYNTQHIERLSDIITIVCPTHGEFQQRGGHHLNLGNGCPNCANSISTGEQQVHDYLLSRGIAVEQQNKSLIAPYHLDMVLPDLDIAIEYNGVYWHSDKFKSKQYHNYKTSACATLGIRLIHIYDYEWNERQSIVISRLDAIVGKATTIHARKCKIITVDKYTRRKFLNENHIQGDVGAAICYGLQYNGELVALQSFGKSRFADYQWELLRFVNKRSVCVVGGASKLFKYFILNNTPLSVISYSDRRWNTGKVYHMLGFKFTHSSAPNYFYTKGNHRISRYRAQKHRLHQILPHVDTTLTEHDNMALHGYNKVWDCGNDVFVWKP